MARHKSCEIGFDRGLKNPNSLARQKGVALCYRLAQRFDNRVGCLRTMKFIRARAKQLRSQKCARYFVVVGFRPALVLTPIRIAIVTRAGVAVLALSVRTRRSGRSAQRWLKRIGSKPVVTLRALQAPPDDQDDHADERD
jgi:hypothetical protein